MKKINSIVKIVMIICGILPGFVSCVNDDLSKCPPAGNVRLLVKLDTEIARASADRYQIDNVTLYIFDRNERFLTSWQGGAYTAGEEYEIILDLAPDEYQFVIWTNHCDQYQSSYSFEECEQKRPLLSQMELYLNCAATNNIITNDIPDLHHGIYWKAEVIENQYNEFTVVLVPNTYKLNFTVEGLTVCDRLYDFTITDNNSHYTFDNYIVSNKDDFRYTRSTGFEDDELKASLKVLRLADERQPQFSLLDNSLAESLYSSNLVKLIKDAYQANGQTVDFTKTFEFDIKITFRASLSPIVSINGWDIIQNPSELE